jgi:hypothetical protein
MDATFAIVMVVATLGFILFTFVLGRRLTKRMLGGSTAKQAEGRRLMETGSKARATILSIEPTGMIMNEINIKCRVQFRVDPLDGSADFQGEKTFFINQTQMPRVGDVWPCWYDAADPSTFGVGQPNLGDPQTLQIFADFGIAHPLADQPVTDGGGVTASTTDAGGADDDRLDALEQLGDLRARGLLTDAEFESEKRRILGS